MNDMTHSHHTMFVLLPLFIARSTWQVAPGRGPQGKERHVVAWLWCPNHGCVYSPRLVSSIRCNVSLGMYIFGCGVMFIIMNHLMSSSNVIHCVIASVFHYLFVDRDVGIPHLLCLAFYQVAHVVSHNVVIELVKQCMVLHSATYVFWVV